MKGLLIRQPWIEEILAGRKTWELRGSSTRTRGVIGLIESGTGTVVGICELKDVLGPLSLAELRRNQSKHRVAARDFGGVPPYSRTHAWVLRKPRRFSEPVPYKHPQGAVIWVNLSRTVERKTKQGDV